VALTNIGSLKLDRKLTVSPVNRGKLAKNRGKNSVDLGNELRCLGLKIKWGDVTSGRRGTPNKIKEKG
jgi:hypothetical protein